MRVERKDEYTAMKKIPARILLGILLLALAAFACIGGGGDGNEGESSSPQEAQTTPTPDATATYGAEQFHLQLTAIAQPAP